MNQRGMSIVGALVGVGITAMAILSVVFMIQISSRQQAQSNFTFQVDQIRRNLQFTLNNSEAWKNTIKASENSPPYAQGGPDFTAGPPVNPGLNCFLSAGANCTDAANNPIANAPINVIRDLNGAVVYNVLANNGFTAQGQPCNQFVIPPANGTDNCPLSFRITWTAICGATCTGAAAVPQISIVPIYNPSTSGSIRSVFNPANYSAVFKQGSWGMNCWIYTGSVLYDSCVGNVGIGTMNPQTTLHIVQTVDDTGPTIEMAGNLPFDSGDIRFLRTRGTAAAPTPVQDGDELMQILAGGRAPNGTNSYSLAIFANAEGPPSGGQVPVRLSIQIYPIGEALGIHSNRNVGLSEPNPDQRFVVNNGTTIGKYTTTGWTHVSDIRLKEDIHSIENALEKIEKLNGVEFKFKADPERKRQLGLIAQDVEKVFPEIVTTDQQGYKSVSYGNLVAPLIEAIKELHSSCKQQDVEAKAELNSMKMWICQKDPTAPFCEK